MHSRFNLPVVSLAVCVAVIAAVAVLGSSASGLAGGHVMSVTVLAKQVFAILVLSWIAGAIGWATVFMFRRDGWHRMEWTAFLPFNYGGRSPFSTSPFTTTSSQKSR